MPIKITATQYTSCRLFSTRSSIRPRNVNGSITPKWKLHQVLLLAAVLLMASIETKAQNQEYQRVVTERAHKIVATLKLTDSAKFLKVRKLVADQYSNLNDIYTRRDNEISPIKKSAASRDSINLAVQSIDQKTTVAIDSLHPLFLSRLSHELNTQQVTVIKDGSALAQAILDNLSDSLINESDHALISFGISGYCANVLSPPVTTANKTMNKENVCFIKKYLGNEYEGRRAMMD